MSSEDLIKLGFRLYSENIYSLEFERSFIWVDLTDNTIYISKDEYSDYVTFYNANLTKLKQLLTLLN